MYVLWLVVKAVSTPHEEFLDIRREISSDRMAPLILPRNFCNSWILPGLRHLAHPEFL